MKRDHVWIRFFGLEAVFYREDHTTAFIDIWHITTHSTKCAGIESRVISEDHTTAGALNCWR